MHELKTEPAFPLPRSPKRPWWLAALLTGIGIGVGGVAALGLSGAAAHGQEPRVATSATVTLPPGSISLDQRLVNIESAQLGFTRALNDVQSELKEVKDRLPPKRP